MGSANWHEAKPCKTMPIHLPILPALPLGSDLFKTRKRHREASLRPSVVDLPSARRWRSHWKRRGRPFQPQAVYCFVQRHRMFSNWKYTVTVWHDTIMFWLPILRHLYFQLLHGTKMFSNNIMSWAQNEIKQNQTLEMKHRCFMFLKAPQRPQTLLARH